MGSRMLCKDKHKLNICTHICTHISAKFTCKNRLPVDVIFRAEGWIHASLLPSFFPPPSPPLSLPTSLPLFSLRILLPQGSFGPLFTSSLSPESLGCLALSRTGFLEFPASHQPHVSPWKTQISNSLSGGNLMIFRPQRTEQLLCRWSSGNAPQRPAGSWVSLIW